MKQTITDVFAHVTGKDQRRAEWFFLACVVVLLFLAPHPGISVSNNPAFYLSDGASVSMGGLPHFYKSVEVFGKGAVARGPLLSCLLALVFLFSGPSVLAAYFLMKTIYAGFLISLYYVGKTLHARPVGVVSIALCLLSKQMYLIGSSIDATILMSLLVLLCFTWTIKGMRTGATAYWVGAGISFSLSFLAKETVIVFLPLYCFLLVYFLRTDRGKAKGLVWFSVVGFLVVLPWVVYVLARAESPLSVLGHFNPYFHEKFSAKLGRDIQSEFFATIFTNLIQFYTVYLRRVTIFAPMVAVSFAVFVFDLARRWRRNEKERLAEGILLLGFVLSYMPVPLSAIAISDVHPRQGFLVYGFMFIILSTYAVFVWTRIVKFGKPRLSNVPAWMFGVACGCGVTLLVLAGLVVLRTGPGQKTISYLKRYSPIPSIKSRYTLLHKEGARWIGSNLAAGDTLVVDGYLGEILGFYTGFKYHFKASFQPLSCLVYDHVSPVIFLITNKRIRTKQSAYRFFWVVDEHSIIRDLNVGTRFAFSNKTKFLEEYFRRCKWAKPLYSNQDIQIYEVTATPYGPDDFRDQFLVFVNESFFEDMEWVRMNSPAEFHELQAVLKAMKLDYEDLKNNHHIISGIMF